MDPQVYQSILNRLYAANIVVEEDNRLSDAIEILYSTTREMNERLDVNEESMFVEKILQNYVEGTSQTLEIIYDKIEQYISEIERNLGSKSCYGEYDELITQKNMIYKIENDILRSFMIYEETYNIHRGKEGITEVSEYLYERSAELKNKIEELERNIINSLKD